MKISEQLQPLAVSIDNIALDPKNARLHPDLNLKAIKKSLEIYSQRKPIVVNKNTGFIEAGNGLLAAARALGWEEIAVVFVITVTAAVVTTGKSTSVVKVTCGP